MEWSFGLALPNLSGERSVYTSSACGSERSVGHSCVTMKSTVDGKGSARVSSV